MLYGSFSNVIDYQALYLPVFQKLKTYPMRDQHPPSPFQKLDFGGTNSNPDWFSHCGNLHIRSAVVCVFCLSFQKLSRGIEYTDIDSFHCNAHLPLRWSAFAFPTLNFVQECCRCDRGEGQSP